MSEGVDCTFARAELAAALGRLAGVLPQRTTLPVLETAKIARLDGGESVRIEATDASRHAEVTLTLAEPCGEFAPFCVSLATLLSLAKAYAGVSGRLSSNRAGVVVFSCGPSKTTLPTFPAAEFPDMRFSEVPFVDAGGGSAVALRLALSRVSYAVCEDLSSPALKGVSFGQNGAGVVAVATNRHILAKEYVKGWEVEGLEQATIPTFGIGALLSFFPNDGALTLRSGETRLRFTNEAGDTLTLPTLDDPFPNFEAVLPRESEIRVSVDRAALLAAAKRVHLMLRNLTNDIGRVVFDASADRIRLSCETENGAAEENVPAEISGADIRIGFSARYLIDTLSSISSDRVTAELTTPNRTSLWRADEGEGLRLIMPLRLP